MTAVDEERILLTLPLLCTTQPLSANSIFAHPQVTNVAAHVQWLFQQNGDKLVLEPPLTGKPTMLNMMDKNDTPTVRGRET